MVNIKITGFTGSNLHFEVDGHFNNGRISLKANQEVSWEVLPTSGVREIKTISMKVISGSDDVFSSDPPSPETVQKKKWKAKVNSRASAGQVYVYNIEWIKESDGLPYVHDPIISIKPRLSVPRGQLAAVTLAVASVFAYLVYRIYMLQNGLD